MANNGPAKQLCTPQFAADFVHHMPGNSLAGRMRVPGPAAIIVMATIHHVMRCGVISTAMPHKQEPVIKLRTRTQRVIDSVPV